MSTHRAIDPWRLGAEPSALRLAERLRTRRRTVGNQNRVNEREHGRTNPTSTAGGCCDTERLEQDRCGAEKGLHGRRTRLRCASARAGSLRNWGGRVHRAWTPVGMRTRADGNSDVVRQRRAERQRRHRQQRELAHQPRTDDARQASTEAAHWAEHSTCVHVMQHRPT